MKQKTQKNKKSEIDKALVIQAMAAISSVNERRIEKMNKEKTVERKNQKKLNERGITLVALVITMVLHYDKVKKCSNSNSFLLSSI